MKSEISELLALASQYDKELPIWQAAQGFSPEVPLARWIDHTLLKAEATPAQVRQVCAEARQAGFAAVCVNPIYVPLVAQELADGPVAVCSVVGFPLGVTLTEAKVAETNLATHAGAREIDMVIPVGMLKGEQYEAVLEDIRQVVHAAHAGNALVKVIIETALLTRAEKIIACLLTRQAGAEFVKTSTGFAAAGATVEDVQLMRQVVGPQMGVKAAGGIRSLADARAMLAAGATRLGSSAGVKIIAEAANPAEAQQNA